MKVTWLDRILCTALKARNHLIPYQVIKSETCSIKLHVCIGASIVCSLLDKFSYSKYYYANTIQKKQLATVFDQ